MRSSILVVVLTVVGLSAGSAPASEGATPRTGGTIVIAAQEQACLNLLVTACRTGGLGLVPAIEQVLEGAFDVAPDLTYRPNLVSHVEVTRSPFTVTYHIRPEATWSDGRPVSARDFEFTWKAVRTRPVLGAPHWLIRQVVPLDPKTVRAVFSEQVADWRAFFRVILPRHALIGENLDAVWQQSIDDPKTRRTIGSGPFLVRSWARGRELTLVRNPRYWGPHRAYVDRLVFRFVPPDGYAEALRRGEVDMIIGTTAIEQAAALELRQQAAPGIRVVSGSSSARQHLELRIGAGGHPALKKTLVRRALAYALDRRAIAQAVLEGLDGERAAAVKVHESVVFLINSPFYRPNWAVYRHRPAEARRLLQEAGCRLGEDGIHVCGGDRLGLRFVTTAGSERRALTLELIRSQLRRVGIEVQPEFTPAAVFFNTVLPGRKFDVALFAWIADPALWSPYWTFACQGEQNYTGYCRRSVTRDLVATTRMLDLDRRVRALRRVDVKLAKDVPVIPLYQPPHLIAMKASIRGVAAGTASSTSLAWNAEDWWLER